MRRKVRIKKSPMTQAKNGVSVGLENYFQSAQKSDPGLNQFGEKDFKLKRVMDETDGTPNIEAEKGEVIMSPGEGGIPDVQVIGGKRHSNGGTKITASPGAIIYSDTKGMKIFDPEALAHFGIKSDGKKGYTPANIAKRFNTTDEKERLLDPKGLDTLTETALKRNLKEKHKKLLDLAILQERMKGKPIPEAAYDRARELGMNPEEFEPQQPQPQQEMPMAAYGAGVIGDPQQYSYGYGGEYNYGGEYAYGGMYEAQNGFGGRPYKWDIRGTLPDGSPRYVKVYTDSPEPVGPPAPPIEKNIVRDPYFITPGGTDPMNDPVLSDEQVYIDQVIVPEGMSQAEAMREAMVGNLETQKVLLTDDLKRDLEKPTGDMRVPSTDKRSVGFNQTIEPLNWDNWQAPWQEQQIFPQNVDPNPITPTPSVTLKKGGEFKPHNMFNPITGKPEWAATEADHTKYANMGFKHEEDLQKAQFGTALRNFFRRIPSMDWMMARGQSETPEMSQMSETYDPNVTYTPSYMRRYLDNPPQTTEGTVVYDRTNQTTTTDGGEKKKAKSSSRSTKVQNIPEDKKKKPGEVAKVGDYFQRGDGKWYKVTKEGLILPTYKGSDMKDVFGDMGNAQGFANKYQFIEDTLADEEVAEEFANQVKAALKDEISYKRKASAPADSTLFGKYLTDEEIDDLSTKKIVDAHLRMNKRNLALAARGIDVTHFSDKTGDVLPEYADMYKKIGVTSIGDAADYVGIPIGEQGKSDENALEQAAYIGFNNMIQQRDTYDDEFQQKIKNFEAKQRGSEDEPLGKISPIDMWYTDTSAGQTDDITGLELEYEEAPWTEVEAEEREKIPAKPPTPKPAFWWAEDIGNIGNLFGQAMGIKKYLPTLETVDLQSPDVLYYDPNQALFANQAATRQAYDFMSGTTPAGQVSTARASGLAGDELERSAGIIGQYYNMNVPIGNEYYRNLADVKNREALFNVAARKKFVDESTIANQQYDNAKRQANRNLFEGYRQGMHNLRKAQVANTLYPNYFLNPAVPKQTLSFWEGRPLEDTGSSPGTSPYMNRLSALKQQYGDMFTEADYRAAVASEMKQVGMTPEELQRQQMMQMYMGTMNPYTSQ
jgi:hypothetical protein